MKFDTEIAVREELARAREKFPSWPTDPFHALAVLGEEVGELNQACLKFTYEDGASIDDVRAEAVQVAAMAIRFLESIDRYEYFGAKMHRQG